MKFKSLVYSQVSGSVGGLTYAHNRGGMYARARSLVVNPNTEPQQAIKSAVAFLVDAWSNTLTDVQRGLWETYAFNTPILNKMGDLTKRTGQNMFLRANVARIQSLNEVIVDAPVIYDLGTFTLPSGLVADASADTIQFAFTTGDAWVSTNDAHLLVYQSRPQNGTRRFFKGPYQLATAIDGNLAVPPTSPKTFNSLFPLDVGQRVFLKFNLASADGRYSDPQRLDVVVTA